MLLEEIISKSNMQQAFERVVGNKGAAGVDGVGFLDFADEVRSKWPLIKIQLEKGEYRPQAVKRVKIPKSNGGFRLLGIPIYIDRMIQQSISQVLSGIYDPEFSVNSYGFRAEKNAHQALEKAKEYINSGYSHVVDLDLEQFFDRVNHDYLMNELSRKIQDKRLLKLVHSILRVHIQDQNNQIPCKQGVPQGGPLSPLLSNIILDKLDKELERQGHRFVRYADDCSIYVKSKRAGDRVMESISSYLEKELKLKVNIEKSMVTRPWRTKLLGFTFYHKKGCKCITVHRKSIYTYKDKIRAITCRSKPYAMEDRLMQIRQLNQGWGNYFRLSEAKSMFAALDEWVRLCYWKQWKTPMTRIHQLERLGAKSHLAYQWGNTRKGYWRIAHSPILQRTLNNTFLNKEGLLSLKEVITPKYC
jgi:RNA-directed DNA polymerase